MEKLIVMSSCCNLIRFKGFARGILFKKEPEKFAYTNVGCAGTSNGHIPFIFEPLSVCRHLKKPPLN